MNYHTFFKRIYSKKTKILLCFVILLTTYFSWAQENPEVLTISFEFDPYSTGALDAYLPDGYITVNGEYDANDLILKAFFAPAVDGGNIKFFILDIAPMLKNPTQQRILNIKLLLEKMTSYAAKNDRSIEIGLKFSYSKNTSVFVDRLFSYTEIPTIVKGLQIDSGNEDFFAKKSYLNVIQNLKYLNLSSNVIGAKKESFDTFNNNLKKLQNLEILNVSDNAIGSLNGNLKLFARQISTMPKLKYVNLENNLIGAYKEDAQEFVKSIKKIKPIVVNLNHNLNWEN